MPKKSPKKSNEYLTFMMVPGPRGRVRRVHITRSALKGLLASLAVGVVAAAFLLVHYVQMRGQVWEMNALRQETMIQKTQIRSFALRMGDLEKQMIRLRGYDVKLRRLAKLNKSSKDKPQVLGMGGPTRDDRNPLDAAGRTGQSALIDQMHQELAQLQDAAANQEVSFQRLVEHFEQRRSLLAATPSMWPVRGWITSRFGYRTSPFDGQREFHRGLDIAGRHGAPIRAPADGIVVSVGRSSGYGRYVIVNHGYGMKTVYGHNSKVVVRVGQNVHRGQVVAHVGNTGHSTGPHLHYEVYVNGLSVNPKKYLK